MAGHVALPFVNYFGCIGACVFPRVGEFFSGDWLRGLAVWQWADWPAAC